MAMCLFSMAAVPIRNRALVIGFKRDAVQADIEIDHFRLRDLMCRPWWRQRLAFVCQTELIGFASHPVDIATQKLGRSSIE
jgi:hypothetical protein